MTTPRERALETALRGLIEKSGHMSPFGCEATVKNVRKAGHYMAALNAATAALTLPSSPPDDAPALAGRRELALETVLREALDRCASITCIPGLIERANNALTLPLDRVAYADMLAALQLALDALMIQPKSDGFYPADAKTRSAAKRALRRAIGEAVR